MGILTRNASAKSARSAVTIIAEGNKFSGEMSIVGKMHIDGIFEGTISSLDSISIGRRGEVHGTIRAHQISVCGLLQGEIHCDDLTVENGGKVRGTVFSEHMVVEREGCFVGERHLKEQVSAAARASSKLVDSAELAASAELADSATAADSIKPGARTTGLTQTFPDLPDRITLVNTTPSAEKNQ